MFSMQKQNRWFIFENQEWIINMKNLFILILIFIFNSCAPKAGNKGNSNQNDNNNGGPRQTRNDRTFNELIKNQSITCEGNCPEYLAKVLIFDHNKYKFCTGTLINSKTLMLAANCLGDYIKLPGISCSKEVHVYFPQTGKVEAQKVNCLKVISADLNNEKDPTLWSSNFAFVELAKTVERTPASLSKKGSTVNDLAINYYLDEIDNLKGIFKTQLCKPVFGSYANPFARNELSSSLLMNNCFYQNSASGSPLVRGGKVFGIISKDILEENLSYILENEMLPGEKLGVLTHAHNLSCVITPIDSAEIRLPYFCEEEIDIFALDRLRQNLRSSESIHSQSIKKIQTTISGIQDKFLWDVNFLESDSALEAEMKPKCFFKPYNWVRNYGRRNTWGQMILTYPHYKLLTKFDSELKAQSFILEEGLKEYTLEFNPRNLYNFQTSYLSIKSNVRSEYIEELASCE